MIPQIPIEPEYLVQRYTDCKSRNFLIYIGSL